MHPLKALTPDGITMLFFQKYWHIVGTDVRKLALDILNNDKDPTELNNTFIALNLKCKNPSSQKDFRPIILCNMAMKVVTNIIVNIMKHILHDVIDEEQSDFVKGRLITYNALIEMEYFHCMKIRKFISSVSYQVLINVHPNRIFLFYWGLCLGDPLSPGLFILCAYVL